MTLWPTLVRRKNQLISADFNQPIFYFPRDLPILDQNHNIGHFSHSILVTEPNSAIGIEKFQKFWIFLESMESLNKYHKFGCFCKLWHFFHSKLSHEFDSVIKNWKIPKILEFSEFHWNSLGILQEFPNFWTYCIFIIELNLGVNFEWKKCPIWQKQPNLWYLLRNSIDSKKI